jgi:glycosyltransferase involved in cell wall biosynthesis/peptidoglycan/xylan/chitin deacetylase (PgdA/CDA1 family)
MTTVSVIVPTYNRKALLIEALQSIHAQTYTDYDIIVVDDGSTDDTRTAIGSQEQAVRYVWKPNGGEASARNYGIRHAHTEYVAFLDSDDRWAPDFLSTTLSYLTRHPDIVLVTTGCRVFPGNERRPRVAESLLQGNLFPRLFMRNFITASAVVVRRSCFQDTGFFDESLDQATDYDMWLRIAKRYPIAFLNQPLCLWRRHEGNISRSKLQHRQHVLDVVTRHFDVSRISRWSYALRRSRLFGSMGRAYRQSGNIEQAGACVSQAVRLAPWRVRAWRDFFIILFARLPRIAGATSDFDRARQHPRSAMRIKNRKGLGWIARRIRHRLTPGARILCYHRVGNTACDPHSLTVTVERFAQHMEYLSRVGHPIRLSQLVEGLRRGVVPRGAVVVTFDDGYASILNEAYPILKRHGIPVTIFVTSRYLGSNREIWSDELEQLLLNPGTLPERLSLDIEGISFQWQAGHAVAYTEQDALRHKTWALESPINPTARHRLFRLLYSRLLPLPDASRLRIINELIRWSGHPPSLRPTHRFLLPDELSKLATEELVEFGAHSESHPVLPKLTVLQQEREIVQSRVAIEQVIGRPIRSFAYPYGARSQETIAVVRSHGFDSACITFDDVVFPGTDPFQLPRICAGRATPDQLARWLSLPTGRFDISDGHKRLFSRKERA